MPYPNTQMGFEIQVSNRVHILYMTKYTPEQSWAAPYLDAHKHFCRKTSEHLY